MVGLGFLVALQRQCFLTTSLCHQQCFSADTCLYVVCLHWAPSRGSRNEAKLQGQISVTVALVNPFLCELGEENRMGKKSNLKRIALLHGQKLLNYVPGLDFLLSCIPLFFGFQGFFLTVQVSHVLRALYAWAVVTDQLLPTPMCSLLAISAWMNRVFAVIPEQFQVSVWTQVYEWYYLHYYSTIVVGYIPAVFCYKKKYIKDCT